MPMSHVYYELQDGYIQNWLVAGPQAISVHVENSVAEGQIRQEIAGKHFHKKLEISHTPTERGPLSEGKFKIGKYEGAWRYEPCGEDHFVDLSSAYPSWHYLRAWAYVQVMSPKEQEAVFTLSVFSPADMWLNGKQAFRQGQFASERPLHSEFQAQLREGANSVWVRIEHAAAGDCRFGLALRVVPEGDPVNVRFPTTIEGVERRNRLETAFSFAYTDRDVFTREDPIALQWPEDAPVSAITTVRLQSDDGPSFAESFERGKPGDRVFMGTSAQLYTGPHKVVLLPGPKEYFEGNRRILRLIPIWSVGNFPYHPLATADTYVQRQAEALQSAIRGKNPIFEAISRMALTYWDTVDQKSVLTALQSIQRNDIGSLVNMLGLLGMAFRFGPNAKFPMDLREPIQKTILEFPYLQAVGDFAEGDEILSSSIQILAGQLYPEHDFPAVKLTGREMSGKAAQSALRWMQKRAQHGLETWDSPVVFCDVVTALSHLADLAEVEEVYELASVLLDKLFFLLAVNSYRGVFGGSCSDVNTWAVLSGWVRETAGISRLLWGMGGFNQHTPVVVSLACMQNYQAPDILGDIAQANLEEMWSLQAFADGVNKVVYKTPDYMLDSAQDYQPGKHGGAEHIWQATLSPEALVFTNHPANSSRLDENRPNYWAGNGILPRVAQWKDALVAVYNLPSDDWMGFTHAFFPIYAFDEYVLRDDAAGRTWAFARKADGYLALTASGPISLSKSGLTAYRELRAEGRQVTWLCQMGRQALDNDFAAFQEKVLAHQPDFKELGVSWQTIRGEILTFGWEGAFERDGESQPLSSFPHHESPFCRAEFPCEQMSIQWGDYLLRLDFRSGGDPETK